MAFIFNYYKTNLLGVANLNWDNFYNCFYIRKTSIFKDTFDQSRRRKFMINFFRNFLNVNQIFDD